jgi:hypothetical protein
MLVRSTRTAAAFAVLLGLLAATLVLRSSASAQNAGPPTPRTLTFTELERGATFTHIRNTKGAKQQSNLQGDVLAFTNPLADSSRKRVGKISVSCTTTTGARNFLKSTLTCVGVMTLADGTLTLQANTTPNSRTTTAAVTGGTGAYANARGVFVSEESRSGSQDTITLVD